MLNLKLRKEIFLLSIKKSIIFKNKYLFFKKISLTVNGRIFRWIKKYFYMKFILPMSNKPDLFLNKNYLFLNKQEWIDYIFINSIYSKNLNVYLKKIQKPSLFNIRGFRLFNRIILKKKGKVSSYVTNK